MTPEAEEGWRARARDGLLDFTRWMFKARKGAKWELGAHHYKLATALTRVYSGETKRLIINIPPRYSKTEFVVNFMAWAIGQFPDCEFIYSSYSGRLAAKSSWDCRSIVQHPEYTALFPHVKLRDDSAAKDEWRTTAGGMVYAVGAGGTITGYGAGKMRPGFGGCFPREQLVETENGPQKIGDIVRSGAPLRVWSFNQRTGLRELRRVVRFWRNPANHLIEISSADGRAFRCTPDHEVLTRAGWVSAIHVAKALDLVDREAGNLGGLLSGKASVDSDLNDAFRVLWLCVPPGVRERLRNACPSLSELYLPDDAHADAVSSGELCGAFGTLENLHDDFARQLCAGATLQNWERAVTQSVLHVVGLCAIREIGERVVRGVAVDVPDLVSAGSWAYELLSDQVRNVVRGDTAVDGQIDPEVSLSVARRFKRSDGACPPDISGVRNLIQASSAGDWTPDTVRYVGHVDETFCLEVEGNHNFILSQSGAIVSNCIIVDDPHKADEATSDVMRENVWDWFQGTMESRTNSPDTPIIVIMQRLHMEDLAGRLLRGDNGEAWEHLCLSAIKADDSALWPFKHSRERLEAMRDAAPYNFSGQYLQQPIPDGGALFKPERIRIEEVSPAGMQECRGWDAGATEGGGDPTVGAKIGRDKAGEYWILDIARKQTGEPRAMAKQIAALDGKRVVISWPQDPGQAGKDQAKSLLKDFAGWTFKTSPETGAKRTRWEPFAAQVNGGNVHMVRAAWNKALIEEMETDGQVHDDQLDALARAFAEVSLGVRSGVIDMTDLEKPAANVDSRWQVDPGWEIQ